MDKIRFCDVSLVPAPGSSKPRQPPPPLAWLPPARLQYLGGEINDEITVMNQALISMLSPSKRDGVDSFGQIQPIFLFLIAIICSPS